MCHSCILSVLAVTVFCRRQGRSMESLSALFNSKVSEDLRKWISDVHGNILTQPTFHRSWLTATCQNWGKLVEAVYNQAHMDHMLCGPVDLAILQSIRRRRAENLISTLANVRGLPVPLFGLNLRFVASAISCASDVLLVDFQQRKLSVKSST
jgi:hypothetical protein